MTCIGYLTKKRSLNVVDSPWGVQYLLRDYPHDRLVDFMGNSGVKWTRLTVSWPSVETEQGRYEWARVDDVVDGLLDRGINVYLGTGCSSHPAYHDFPAGEYYPPTQESEALKAYCRYAAALVKRYKGRVRHYEIWNEPNIRNFWRPEPDPEAYALMVREVGGAMKAVDPDIRVLAGVLAGVGEEQTRYAVEFMSEPGTAEVMDILTYHPYNPSPETTLEDIIGLKEAVREIKPEMPIWQGECGCPSSGDTIHFRGDAPWGYNVQSKWVLRRLLTDYLAGAEISIYFLIAEFKGNLHSGSPELRMGYNTKGLIQHTTWKPKPAYHTLQNLAAVIDASWKRVEETAEIEVVDPGIFYGIGPHENRFPCVPWQVAMRREEEPLLVYWLPWRPQEIVEPATVGIDWPGVSWEEPVCVDLLSGKVSEAVLEGDAVQVPMADYPMIVTECSVLDLADQPQQPDYEALLGNLRWTY